MSYLGVEVMESFWYFLWILVMLLLSSFQTGSDLYSDGTRLMRDRRLEK